MHQSNSHPNKDWFFQRCRNSAIRLRRSKSLRRSLSKSSSRPLFAEALEARVLFSGSPGPIPEVTVDATQPTQSEIISPVDGEGVGTRPQPNLNGDATGSAGAADEEMLEEHFTFTVEFENAGTTGHTGYGPYLDVVVSEAVEIDAPVNEFGESTDIEILVSPTRAIPLTNTLKAAKVYSAEDLAAQDESLNALAAGTSDWRALGATNVWVRPTLSFSGAATVGPNTATFGPNPDFFSHPLIEGPSGRIDANDFQSGEVFYVVRLPFGSYSEGQAPANIRFTGRLDQDPGGDTQFGAKVGEAIDIRARGGFYLGCDPDNNPDEDPAIAHLQGDSSGATTDGLFRSDTITPTVVEVIKRGPDDSTLGPTDLLNYEIEVDIAAGQTIDDLVITDILGDSIVYVPNSLQISYERIAGVPDILAIDQPGVTQFAENETALAVAGGSVTVANADGDLVAGSVNVTSGATTYTDDGNGVLLDGATNVGTIDYVTGTITFTNGEAGPVDVAYSHFASSLRIVFDEIAAGSNFDPVANDHDQDLEEDLNWNTAGGPNIVGDGIRRANIYITYQAYAGEFTNGVETLGDTSGGNYDAANNRLSIDLTTNASASGNFTDATGAVVAVTDNDTGAGGGSNQRVDSDSHTEDVLGLGSRKVLTARYDNSGNLVSNGPNFRRSIPGDIIEYTLELSVSDFLSFDQLSLQDYLDDGLSYYENTNLSVGDDESSISTFQTYWALFQNGQNVVGEFSADPGSDFTFNDIVNWEGFTTPHVETDIALGNNYVGNLHEPDNVGKDLLTWNLSSELTLTTGLTANLVNPLGQSSVSLALANAPVDIGEDIRHGDGSGNTVQPAVANLSVVVTTDTGDVITLVPDPSNPSGNLLVSSAVDSGGGDVSAFYAVSAVSINYIGDGTNAQVDFNLAPDASRSVNQFTSIDATYDQVHRFGALVDRDVDGDGIVSAAESALHAGATQIDRNSDGLGDGFDLAGDADTAIDVFTHLSGDLVDGSNTSEAPYSVFYSTPSDKDAADLNDLNNFVVDSTSHQIDPISSDGRTLTRDVDNPDRLFLRFFARVDGTNVNEGSADGENDVNLQDDLFNNSIAEGVQVIGGVTTTTDGVDEFIPTESGLLVRDSDVWRFEVEGGEFRKFTVAINSGSGSESVLDVDPNDGVTDDFDNATGSFGADGNVDNPVLKIGDRITYRLRAELPLAQAEDLYIQDFLPLPVFDLSQDYPNGITQIVNGSSAGQYDGTDATLPDNANGGAAVLGNSIYWTFGPDHNIPSDVVSAVDGSQIPDLMTFQGTVSDPSEAPDFSVTFNESANAIVWNFGSISQDIDSSAPGAVIDILFTVELNAQQFSDDFELTNTASTNFVNSAGQIRGPGSDIASVELLSPDLNIRKGVIGVTPSTDIGGPELINANGDLSQLGNTGENAEFAHSGHSQTNSVFNSLNVGATATTTEATITDEVLTSMVNGVLTTNLDTSNVGTGTVTVSLNHQGDTILLTDDGAGNLTTGNFTTGTSGGINVTSATIDYLSGQIDIAAQVSTEFDAAFETTNNIANVVNAVVLEQVNDNVLTTGSLLDGDFNSGGATVSNVIPGSVELTINDPLLTPQPLLRDVDHNGNPANGTLFQMTFDGGGAINGSVAVGTINYSDGSYSYRVNIETNTSSVPMTATFSHQSGAATSSTGSGLGVNGVSSPTTLAGAPLIAGSTRITLGTAPNQSILADDIGNAAGPSGQLFYEGGDGSPVGTINYQTGEITFSALDTVTLSATYDAHSGPGIITSEYIHGVNDFTGDAQLNNFSEFVDSNVRNVDAGDVITYGIFVENIGAAGAFDIKIADEFLTGLDTLDDSVATALSGTDSNTTALVDSLNLQIWRGDRQELAAGTDYEIEYTPGRTATFAVTGLIANGSTVAVPTTVVQAGEFIIPGSYEIIVSGDSADIAHQLRIFDVPRTDGTGAITGVGDLHYHNPNTNTQETVGTIDYRTNQITWTAAIVNSDNVDVSGNTTTLSYDLAASLSSHAQRDGVANFFGNDVAESDTGGVAKSSYRTVLDQSEIVQGSVTVFVDYFGLGVLEFNDNVTGGFTLDAATVPAGVNISNVSGTIDYENGEVVISWDDTWEASITYNSATFAGGTPVTENINFPDDSALHNVTNITNAPAVGEAIIPNTFTLVIADESGDTSLDLHYVDDGTGNLVRDDNKDGDQDTGENFIVGAVNYGTGDFSITHQNSDRTNGAVSVGTLNFELSNGSNGELNTTNIVDGTLANFTATPASGDFILPGSIDITNTVNHQRIVDDGLGNLVIFGSSGTRVGTVNYATNEINIDYAEVQDAATDYATTNAFRIHFNNAAGTLDSGRSSDSDLPDNESGSNVLVITYDLEVGDSFQPNEEFSNTSTIDGYSATFGGANVLVDTSGGAVELTRPTDAATAEGVDVSVSKRLLETNQDHTTFSTFQAVTIELNDGTGFTSATTDFTINNTATGTIDVEQHTGSNLASGPRSNGTVTSTNFSHRATDFRLYDGNTQTIELGADTGFFATTDGTRFSATDDTGDAVAEGLIYIPGITDDPDLTLLQIGPVVQNSPFFGVEQSDDGIGSMGQLRDSLGVVFGGTNVIDDGSGLSQAASLTPGANTVSSPVVTADIVSPFSTVFTIPDYPTYTWADGSTIGAFMNGFDIIVDPGGPNEAHYSTNARVPGSSPAVNFPNHTNSNVLHNIYAKTATNGNFPDGIVAGTIVGNQDINLDGNATLSEDGQIRFLENINPNGDPVFLSYIAGIPESSVVYHNAEQPVALDWETNFGWTAVTADNQLGDGGPTEQGMSFVIQADPDGANAIGINNPETNRFTGTSNHAIRGDGGLGVEPHIEIKFDYDWDRSNDGNRGQLIIARDGINTGRNDLVNIEFPFGELMQQNIAGAQGDHVRGNTGDTTETTPADRTSRLYQYNAANFDANIQYDSANETLTVTINALDDTGAIVATSGPVVVENFNVVDILGTGSAYVGFGGATGNNQGSSSLVTSFDFTGTFSNDQHHQNAGTIGEDVAIGEEVTFGLIVDVPEGTTEFLTITDILPAGLEVLDIEIVTAAADSGGLLDNDFGGTIDPSRFSVDIGTNTNLTRAELVALQPTGPGDVIIRLEDPVVNNADAIQDATGDDATDIPVSTRNDQFVIKVVTRVLNGVDFDPIADGVLETVGGTATEVTDNGNTGLNTSLSDNTHDAANLDAHDHSDLLNDVRIDYLDGDTGDDVRQTGNSVEIDLVEPDLKVDKRLVNTSNPGGSSIVQVGETTHFVVEISHTQLGEGDATQSTADAFNINIFDNLTTGGLLGTALDSGDARIVKLEIISAPGYINSGEPVTLYDASGLLPVENNVDGIFTTVGSSVRGMAANADPLLDFATNLQNNILDFTLDQLRLGDKFVFAYEISVDSPDLVNADLNGDTAHDIENEVNVTYYSLPVEDTDGDGVLTDEGLEEIRERRLTDQADIQVIENDVNLNIVKGVLAVAPSGAGTQTFTTDPDSAGAGTGAITGNPWAAFGQIGHSQGFPVSNGNFFSPGPLNLNPAVNNELQTGINSLYLEVQTTDGASLNTAGDPVLPGSVEILIFSDQNNDGNADDANTDGTVDPTIRVRDVFGDGNLYYETRIGIDGTGGPIWRTIDIGDGAIGTIDYTTGDYSFNVIEASSATFRFSESLRGDVIKEPTGTAGTITLPQGLIVPGSFEVFSDALPANNTPIFVEPSTPDGRLLDTGGTQVGFINYAKGEVTFLAGAPSIPAASISYTYSATSQLSANDELPDATSGATIGSFSASKAFPVPGSYVVQTGSVSMGDVFADGRLFVLDGNGDPILLDSTGTVTTDPTQAVPVGSVNYLGVAGASFDIPTAITSTGNTTAYDPFIQSHSITASYTTYQASTSVNLNSQVLHPDLTNQAQWNEAIDRDLTEADGGVDAGDIITYGIIVENTGSSNAYDIVISDGLFDFNGNDVLFDGADLGQLDNGTINATTLAADINLQVSRGDGTPVAHTLSYDVVNGDFVITLDGELAPGATSVGADPSNVFGDNVFLISYDLEVNDSWEAGDFVGNVSRVESYAASDNGGAITTDANGQALNVSTTDSAFIEGRGLEVEKTIITTSEGSTAQEITGIAVSGAAGSVANLDNDRGIQVGSLNFTVGSTQYTDDGNGFLVQTLTTVVANNGTDSLTLQGDEIVSGTIDIDGTIYDLGWDAVAGETTISITVGGIVAPAGTTSIDGSGNTVITFGGPAITGPVTASYQQSIGEIDYPGGNLTLTDEILGGLASFTIDSEGDSTTDVTYGEEVVYGLVVTLPEGTVSNLQLIDDLPAGLEVLSIDLVTAAADSNGLLSADYAGGAITGVSVTDGTFTGTVGTGSPLTVNGAIQGTSTITLDFGATTVNQHDATQDTDFNNVSDTPESFANNQFLVRVTTRVQNGLDDNPVTNFGNTVATGVADLNAAAETALNVGDVITNQLSFSFTDAASGGSEGASVTVTNGSNSVDVEVVAPNLDITKVSDVTTIGAGAIVNYTLTINHAADSASDAFGVNVFDNLTDFPYSTPTGGTAFAQGNYDSVTITKRDADGNIIATASLADIDSVANTSTTTDPSNIVIADASNFTVDALELVIDSLAVGETLTVEYGVRVGIESQAATDAMLLDDPSTITQGTQDGDPGTDLNNTANLGWYSVSIDPSDPNPEAAEYTNSASAEVEVDATSELSIVKTDDLETRQRGEVYIYDLEVTNSPFYELPNSINALTLPSAANVIVTDIVPTELLFDPYANNVSSLDGANSLITIANPGGATPAITPNFIGAATLPANPNPGDWAFDPVTRVITIFLGSMHTDATLNGFDNPNVVLIGLEVQVDPTLSTEAPGLTTITNTASVTFDTDGDGTPNSDPLPDDNTSTDVNQVTIPELSITKEDGIQDRVAEEEFSYEVQVTNAETHTEGILDGAPGAPALGVVVTETLSEYLTLNSNTISVTDANTGAVTVLTQTSAAIPNPGEFTATVNPDGTTTIVLALGSMNYTDTTSYSNPDGFTEDYSFSNQISIEIPVVVNDNVPEELTEDLDVQSTVSVTSDTDGDGILDIDLNPDNNADFDLDKIRALNLLFGGSQILEGFRIVDTSAEEFFGNNPDEDEDGNQLPILTMMPFYSGVADPGTVLNIKIVSSTGGGSIQGETTVVAGAGGGWIAKFPGMEMTEEPHVILISQTPPTWDMGNARHGFNLRTYFAPTLNSSQVQQEGLTVSSVMGRRLNAVAMPAVTDANQNPIGNHNTDWRLGEYENLAKSSIGGV